MTNSEAILARVSCRKYTDTPLSEQELLQLNKAPQNLNKEELEDVVRFACTAAGLSTTRPGGISSVPDYEAVMSRFNAK